MPYYRPGSFGVGRTWLLAAGCWRLAAGGWRLETGSWKLETDLQPKRRGESCGDLAMDKGPQPRRSAKNSCPRPHLGSNAIHAGTGWHPSVTNEVALQRQGALNEAPRICVPFDALGSV